MLGTKDINRDKPRFCTLYGYFLILGSLAGILSFAFKNALIQTSFLSTIQTYFNLSHVVLFYVIAILSVLAFITGIGILLGQKFGWILAQVFFIFLIVRSLYGVFTIPIFDRVNDQFPLWIQLLKFSLRASIAGLLFFYFNKRKIISYFDVEREEANRIYLLSFATFTIVIFLRLLI